MKAGHKDFAGIAQRAARQCRVFFLCGPDEAGASAAADRLVALLPDPGERIELSGAALRKDPALLGDEARSGSLFGDARHILVRASGDEALDAIGNHLLGPGAGCPVVVVASGAGDKSRTARLLEKRDDALVVIFWPPDLKDVAGAVRAMADAAGLRLGGEQAERLARAAGLDVRLARAEIDKLALYLDASPQAPQTLDNATLDALSAETEDDGFMALVNTVLAGNTRKLPAELARMRELSLNPVGLLLAFERRAAQLAQLAAKIGPRGNIAATLKAERVFWRDMRDLEEQLRRWRGERLERLLARLVALHRTLLANSQSAPLLLAQELAEIARFAAPRRK